MLNKAGLDGRAVIDVISKGAAQSWQMENRYEAMIDDEFDFGFAVDWMVKDLKICLDEATQNGISLPVTEIVKTYYEEIQGMGWRALGHVQPHSPPAFSKVNNFTRSK